MLLLSRGCTALVGARHGARFGGACGLRALRPPTSRLASVRLLSKAPNYPSNGGTVSKLRWLVREYGAIGIVTHFSIYFTTLGGLFLGVDNGVGSLARMHARAFFGVLAARAHALHGSYNDRRSFLHVMPSQS